MLVSSRLIVVLLAFGLLVGPGTAFGQQQASINGKVLDPDGLALPGATVTITDQNTGFSRTVVSAETGAYSIGNLTPGTYTIVIEMPGFATITRTDLSLRAGVEATSDWRLQLAGVQEAVTVTGAAPLVEKSSNKIGGTLTGQEIEDVPSNFRNFTALTQLIPGMTPNPAQSTFEGGQVVANGTPAQSNVYLLDGMYNNDDRLGGSQGTQVRMVLDNVEEYMVLQNQYSAEYGGGAGAIINMVSRGGTNNFSGRVYGYFRDDKFNARGHFLPDDADKPDEKTRQFGFALGGPVVRDKAHFYFTIEKDQEEIAGLKRFPAESAPLARDFVGTFEVDATNYFGRGDVQLNDTNFVNARWLLETAPTKGEGFNVSNETTDAQGWEEDWDHLFSMSYTSVLSDRATNVIRVGRIGEQLNTGAQTYFDVPNVDGIGFAGRNPFDIGQSNDHPSFVTGVGGTGTFTTIRTYTFDESFSYFVPDFGGEHTFKAGGTFSRNKANPRAAFDSGTFTFESDLPYDPNNPETFPTEFDIVVGPPGTEGFGVFANDRRYALFVEDKWRVSNNLTLNLGVRYDNSQDIPESKNDFGPRAGFAWDVTGQGTTVVRGGVGRFNAYLPISVTLNIDQQGVITRFPTISVNSEDDPNSAIMRPDVIADSDGNLGVAVLSAAGRAELEQRRNAVLAGRVFNTAQPRVDGPRQMPYQWAWSVGVSHELMQNMAVTVDYVGNMSRDQHGLVDINEPVNGVRPGVAVFDPNGTIIPAEARGQNFRRVLQSLSPDDFDGEYRSFQASLVKRYSNRWSARVAYTLQDGEYVGLGNPDTRRVWLDNDIRADFGTFASNRTNVLAMSGTFSPFQHFTVAGVLSAIDGSPINETVGRDANGDNDSNNDRPIRGIDDAARPIQSEVDSQGRAVINGLDGPGSFELNMSFRYQVPLQGFAESIDLFYDIFNLTNRENLVPPTGARNSAQFLVPIAARFARQMQFGIRLRF